MIMRAVVEELISPYLVRVRIPQLDSTKQSSIHTTTENLNLAVICTQSGCEPNLQLGDIVIVSKDDVNEYVTVLGHLYKPSGMNTYSNMVLSNFSATSSASLPYDTSIGEVSATNIYQLKGVSKNIQAQLDELMLRTSLIDVNVSAENANMFVTVSDDGKLIAQPIQIGGKF